MWRSLVAHLTGGQGAAGSNPVIPTVFSQVSNLEPFGLAVAREDSAGNLRVRGPFRRSQGVARRPLSCSAPDRRGRATTPGTMVSRQAPRVRPERISA